MKLKIAWLYPILMGTYGDRGNVLALVRRCQWRGIDVEVEEISLESPPSLLTSCNLIFMGGAQDRQQQIVSKDLLDRKGHIIREMIENGLPALFVCASYQFMGRFYKTASGTEIPGLGLFDLYTVNPGVGVRRCIGNVVANLNISLMGVSSVLVGFENHGGRTFLGDGVQPLGWVKKGWGNNGRDQTEGAIYKNALGSYFHGPFLPRNPSIGDFLISKALGIAYNELAPLPDELEMKTHDTALNRR